MALYFSYSDVSFLTTVQSQMGLHMQPILTTNWTHRAAWSRPFGIPFYYSGNSFHQQPTQLFSTWNLNSVVSLLDAHSNSSTQCRTRGKKSPRLGLRDFQTGCQNLISSERLVGDFFLNQTNRLTKNIRSLNLSKQLWCLNLTKQRQFQNNKHVFKTETIS